MSINEQQLRQILPNAGRQAGVFVPVLNVTTWPGMQSSIVCESPPSSL
jgi:hypothetical protein